MIPGYHIHLNEEPKQDDIKDVYAILEMNEDDISVVLKDKDGNRVDVVALRPVNGKFQLVRWGHINTSKTLLKLIDLDIQNRIRVAS